MKAGDRVKVDFISESRTIYSGKRFTGYGVLDRVEDGRVFGRLDDGTPFMCLCADVEVVGMSDFDEYIKNKYPSDYLLMKVRYPNQELSELYSDQFEVWQHQQAIIDNLKAQLNNMEASYIEKKKVEDQQKRIDEYKKLTTSIRNEFDLWSDDSEFADVIEAQIENLEALRGGHV